MEVYFEEELVGGLYGVNLGGFFAGESMFHLDSGASKVALCYLVQHLQITGRDMDRLRSYRSAFRIFRRHRSAARRVYEAVENGLQAAKIEW